ncbi:MAG: hypothetical protein IJC78_07510 [Clostridia bacterium]|nr:hypothetical protein [Clostridia bacterium]
MAENFKKTMFGYSKKEVCEYILFLKNDMERKLSLLEEEKNKEIEAMQQEIASLREKLSEAETRAEKETEKVSAVIVDARRFADELKSAATAKNEKEMRENTERNALVEEKIMKCSDGVDEIRRQIKELLDKTDRQLRALDEELQSVGKEPEDTNVVAG